MPEAKETDPRDALVEPGIEPSDEISYFICLLRNKEKHLDNHRRTNMALNLRIRHLEYQLYLAQHPGENPTGTAPASAESSAT